MRRSGGLSVGRFVFPLLIVGVAVALGVWSTQLGRASSESVERFVRLVCLDVCEGGDAEILLARSGSVVAAGVLQQFDAICEAQDGKVDRIDIDVTLGDIQPHPGSESATHSVLIGDGNVHMLGLRLSATGESQGVRILGYWIPEN